MKHQTHESPVEHHDVKRASDRSFGLTVGGILLAIGVVRWWLFDATPWSTAAFVGIGSVLMLFGQMAPSKLAPLNRAWMRLGLLLASIVNPIILFLLFVIVFVPTALVLRLQGRDALGLRRDPTTGSYWIERTPPAPHPDTMIHQF